MTVFTAAGILPKSTYNGSEYYYFGVTKKSGELSTFCGSLNKNEKARKGAIREFMEESLGAIAKKDKIKKIFEKNKQVTEVKNSRVKQITYIMPVKIKENPMKKFDKKRSKPGLSNPQKEMTEIVAVKTSDLINALRAGNHFIQGHRFRGDAWGTLQIALAKNQL